MGKYSDPRPRSCSFCDKAQSEVKVLIAGPMVHICDGCVAMCATILLSQGVRTLDCVFCVDESHFFGGADKSLSEMFKWMNWMKEHLTMPAKDVLTGLPPDVTIEQFLVHLTNNVSDPKTLPVTMDKPSVEPDSEHGERPDPPEPPAPDPVLIDELKKIDNDVRVVLASHSIDSANEEVEKNDLILKHGKVYKYGVGYNGWKGWHYSISVHQTASVLRRGFIELCIWPQQPREGAVPWMKGNGIVTWIAMSSTPDAFGYFMENSRKYCGLWLNVESYGPDDVHDLVDRLVRAFVNYKP